MSLEFSKIEQVYEELAKALDKVADEEREIFLCKFSLLLARETGDLPLVIDMIEKAQSQLVKI